jgi:hypothetical protein
MGSGSPVGYGQHEDINNRPHLPEGFSVGCVGYGQFKDINDRPRLPEGSVDCVGYGQHEDIIDCLRFPKGFRRLSISTTDWKSFTTILYFLI